ncbi:MAG: hypothetical protein BWX87_02600 [Bacteroidetes bacterium ADurb.Bin123]|nr:MAG: hypothetical protein BWX87_02600 [Bacteroidetes bacterium ADurb.Bin123]
MPNLRFILTGNSLNHSFRFCNILDIFEMILAFVGGIVLKRQADYRTFVLAILFARAFLVRTGHGSVGS